VTPQPRSAERRASSVPADFADLALGFADLPGLRRSARGSCVPSCTGAAPTRRSAHIWPVSSPLALDQRQRDPLTQQPDSMRTAKLMRDKAPPDARLDRRPV